MAHFLYPFTGDRYRATAQYGNVAIKYLVTMFLDLAPRRRTCGRRFSAGR